MYELVYGFNIEFHDQNKPESIWGKIDIYEKDLHEAELKADSLLGDLAFNLAKENFYLLSWHFDKLKPWQIRKDHFCCRIDGSVRKSEHDFAVVLRPSLLEEI